MGSTESAKRGDVLSGKQHLAGTAKLAGGLLRFLQFLDF